MKKLQDYLPFLSKSLIETLEETAMTKHFPANTTIIQSASYVNVIPIVLNGLVKVFIKNEDKNLLLYYIKAQESCVMSFSAAMQRQPSAIFAVTEEDTDILLLPVEHLEGILRNHPQINRLFFEQYNQRYVDLLETLKLFLFQKMDVRLYNYLKEKAELTQHNPLKLTHQQIASEMGTAREVVSRLLKKLEKEDKIESSSIGIRIL